MFAAGLRNLSLLFLEFLARVPERPVTRRLEAIPLADVGTASRNAEKNKMIGDNFMICVLEWASDEALGGEYDTKEKITDCE